MSDETDGPTTDRATVVPPAAPLTGEPAETDQPAPSDVLPGGDATEVGHLRENEA